MIGAGNVEGLLAFLDYLVQKGYATHAAIHPLKVATRAVFSKMEGEKFRTFDVRTFDPDEYLDRFENRVVARVQAGIARELSPAPEESHGRLSRVPGKRERVRHRLPWNAGATAEEDRGTLADKRQRSEKERERRRACARRHRIAHRLSVSTSLRTGGSLASPDEARKKRRRPARCFYSALLTFVWVSGVG